MKARAEAMISMPEIPHSTRMVELSTFVLSHSNHFVQCCPTCGGPLALHQPAPDEPDRLLAICDSCRGWYLFNTRKHTMTRVPE